VTGQGQQFQFPTPLYRMQDVSQTLNLTPDQINRLNQITQNLENRYRTDINSLSGVSADDRARRIMDLQQRFGTEWMNSTRDIFTQDQLGRYRQLDLQYRGFSAFVDPAIRQRLNLTDQQMEQVRQAQDWARQQLQNLRRQGLSQDQVSNLYREYVTQYRSRLNQILTPEQQQLWQQMTGQPFNFQITGSTSNGTIR